MAPDITFLDFDSEGVIRVRPVGIVMETSITSLNFPITIGQKLSLS